MYRLRDRPGPGGDRRGFTPGIRCDIYKIKDVILYSCGDLPLPSAILILVAGPRFPPGARTRTARAFNPGFRLRVRAFG